MAGMKSIMRQTDDFRVPQTRPASTFRCGWLSQVSLIIPVGQEDSSWQALIGDLVDVGSETEVLIVAAHAKQTEIDQLSAQGGPQCGVHWIATAAGRARQMNVGAKLATRPFLWFLHADSRVSADALSALERSLDAQPHALHYFDLAFQNDGPSLVWLNAWGARVRSRCLGLPFGDQGLCMSRDLFQRLGGFDETAAYGEDHLLVWAARRHRAPLRCVGAAITTSARKYRSNGWLATTALHGWRTCRQAIPEYGKLLWSRLS